MRVQLPPTNNENSNGNQSFCLPVPKRKAYACIACSTVGHNKCSVRCPKKNLFLNNDNASASVNDVTVPMNDNNHTHPAVTQERKVSKIRK